MPSVNPGGPGVVTLQGCLRRSGTLFFVDYHLFAFLLICDLIPSSHQKCHVFCIRLSLRSWLVPSTGLKRFENNLSRRHTLCENIAIIIMTPA